MVYGCGNKCVKFLVFIFNFLVFVVGIVVLAMSLSIRYSNAVQTYFQNLLKGTDVNLSQMYIALYVLAAVGALLILTGFLGCCGAWWENSCMLAVFFSIILVLFVAELACGIAILVNKDQFKTNVFNAIADQVGNYNAQGSKALSQDEKNSIKNMQNQFKCCGCRGVSDYGTVDPTFFDHENMTTCINPTTLTVGCCDKVWNDAESQLSIVGGVAIGILVIELLAMIFSCILCQAFRRGDYQYA